MTDFRAPPVPPQAYTEPQNVPPSAPEEVNVQPAEVPVQTPAAAPVETHVAPQPQQTEEAGPKTEAIRENIQKLQEKTAKLQQQFNALPESKKHLIVYLGVFFVGLLLGWLFFGGSSEPAAPVVKGLQGVVSNPDIQEKLKRCGMVSPSSPCVLYVMNNYHYEKMAKDFFDTAVTLTQRPDFLIRSENVRYGTIRIPPGYFAEIKIPEKR